MFISLHQFSLIDLMWKEREKEKKCVVAITNNKQLLYPLHQHLVEIN